MTTFKHILLATDFGEAADRALDFAIELASRFDSKLTLLHASWAPPPVYAGYAEGMHWPVDDMAKAATEELETLLSKTRLRYPKTEAMTVSAEPWETILAVAKSRDADLIVMGTHGRRGLSRVFLGSVAEKVVRLSPIPVLTISGKADQEAKEQGLARTDGKRHA